MNDDEPSVIAGGCHRAPVPNVAEIMRAVDEATAKRIAAMPTEQDALLTMFSAWVRLKELGWSEASYCPKDGSWFDAIEAGSTGIHKCQYTGKWPKGSWWVASDNDLWPSRPILWRPTAKEQGDG